MRPTVLLYLVGARQVDAQAAHLGRQQEEEHGRVLVEAVDEFGARGSRRGAVHAVVRVLPLLHIPVT